VNDIHDVNPEPLVQSRGTLFWEGLSESVRCTEQLGEVIGKIVRPGDLIALDGELGSGKTQLVRGLVRAMGIDATAVSSPTFVLMQQYTHPHQALMVLHVDAYRLGGEGDADSIGWESDLFTTAVVVVEWAARLEGQLPADRLAIELDHADLNSRHMSVTACGTWFDRIEVLTQAFGEVVKQ